MTRLTDLLQNADPLAHEAMRLDDTERDRIRRTLLRSVSSGSSGAARVRRPLVWTLVMGAVVVVATAMVLWSMQLSTSVLAAVRFEVRLAEERPANGLVVASVPDRILNQTVQPAIYKLSNRLIYLHPNAVVSNDDIAHSWVVDDGSGQFGVGVEFVASGTEKMRRATSGHIGRPVAILIDGRVVTAPILRSAIGDSAVITGDYTRSEAERIAAGISPQTD